MAAGERFDGIRRIAVLRGGGLGDLLFAVPAITALKAAYPEAQLDLLGSSWAPLLEGRLPFPVRTVRLPPLTELSGDAADPRLWGSFLAELREPRIDLAVQLHGGGRQSNPFLLRLEPGHSVGCATPDAVPLERSLPYIYYQHEVLRALEVASLAGADPVMIEPRLRALPEDEELAERARERLMPADGPLVVVHPGATDPRRRWPPAKFAEVARRLAADGAAVIVIGAGGEAALVQEVVDRAASARVAGAAGLLDQAALVGLLATAALVIANDSGPRHLAAALGTATCAVYWFGNVINAGPLTRARHRLRMSWIRNCPVCGIDVTQVGWTAERCPHDPSFVEEVPVAEILEDARALLGRPAPGHALSGIAL